MGLIYNWQRLKITRSENYWSALNDERVKCYPMLGTHGDITLTDDSNS